jgi:hypothetical protein
MIGSYIRSYNGWVYIYLRKLLVVNAERIAESGWSLPSETLYAHRSLEPLMWEAV